MPILALVSTIAWIGLVALVPIYRRGSRAGDVGAVTPGVPGSPEWWARRISAIGFLFAVAAPIADLVGLPPIAPLDRDEVHLFGLALVLLGILVTLTAQAAMGDAWRADVDPDARTPLVTTGPFRFVRNPIFAGMAVSATGLTLLVTNVPAVAMLLCFVAAWQIQVRLVEEPYLRRVHGEAYRRYAARTGRFVPWLGRLDP